MDQWSLLKDVIENPDIDEFIRSSCLDALLFSVVKERIERSEIIDYFKSLFLRILNGELDDELLCTHLASACSDFWPGECLEEIRESFGLDLVDETYLDIECVIEKFLQGKDACIETLQKRIQKHNFWETLPDLPDERRSLKIAQFLQLSDQAEAHAERILKEVNTGSQRNEICGCGSGKKYKKCCMNARSQKIPSKVIIEESVISYGPLEESEAVKAIAQDDKESIFALYFLLEEDPEEVLQKTPEYISKYPNIPMLYNFLYGAYRRTDQPREAMKLLKDTLQLFPDYLFARTEYALYLLRRGEPEKAYATLENAGTLSQLYPERKVFHVSEWTAFSYVMSLYWIQKGDINQAKIYLAMLQKTAPDSYQITDLQQKMRAKLFLQSMENLQKKHSL